MQSTTRAPVLVKRLVGIVALAMLAGCAVPFPSYSVSSNNISVIRNAKKSVELGDFLGRQDSVSCRFNPISPGGDRTFAQYLRGAFNDELVIAGTNTGTNHSTLSVRVLDVSVDCGNVWGKWVIETEVRIANQAPFKLTTTHEFDGNFWGGVVVSRATAAFVPAIQDTIADIIGSPAYRAEFAK